MNITRRDALLGATAAAAVTGLTTAPLAFKAAGVKAALAGDPVLPAYEAFEAARLKYIAISDHVYTVAYLVSQLEQHIGEQRRLFSELFIAAGGSAA